MPERNVLPKPVQKPHPPMWVTVTSPGTELDAADRGIGCLGVAAAGYDEQERRTARVPPAHRAAATRSARRERRGHDAELPVLPRGPRRRGRRVGHGAWSGTFGLANAHLLWTREAYPTRAYQSLGNLAPRAGRREVRRPGRRVRHPRGHLRRRPRPIIVAAIKRWESLGVDGINFLLNALEAIPQEEVLDSMRLFAAEVMPKFRS